MPRLLVAILILSHVMTTAVFARCQIVWLDAPTPAQSTAVAHAAEHAGVHECWSLDCHSHNPDSPKHTHLPEEDAARKASRLQSAAPDVLPMLTCVTPCLWAVPSTAAEPSFVVPVATLLPPREPPQSGRTSHLLF